MGNRKFDYKRFHKKSQARMRLFMSNFAHYYKIGLNFAISLFNNYKKKFYYYILFLLVFEVL